MEDSLGIYSNDSDWFRHHSFSWFSDAKFQKNAKWNLSDNENLILGNRLTERVSVRPNWKSHVAGQATAVYDAQIKRDGVIVRRGIIVKIFMRIPDCRLDGSLIDEEKYLTHENLPKDDKKEKEYAPKGYAPECAALAHLTAEKCTSTPHLIRNFAQNEQNPWVAKGFLRKGFLCFVVMQKVPGKTVSQIWQDEPTTSAQWKEQRQIMESFKHAFMEVRRLGVVQLDPGLRNVIWDKEHSKCYLIDFEKSEIEAPNPVLSWQEDLYPEVHADYTFIIWGFENKETRQKLDEWDKYLEQNPVQGEEALSLQQAQWEKCWIKSHVQSSTQGKKSSSDGRSSPAQGLSKHQK